MKVNPVPDKLVVSLGKVLNGIHLPVLIVDKCQFDSKIIRSLGWLVLSDSFQREMEAWRNSKETEHESSIAKYGAPLCCLKPTR